MLKGSMDVKKLSNHPVHLVDKEGNLNPTALVPFCSISDNYLAMGVKIDQIDVPVCNSFRPKIRKDQLCYTVDLNEIKKKTSSKNNVFFTFFIDFNEDRELSVAQNMKEQKNYEAGNRNRCKVRTEVQTTLTYFGVISRICRLQEKKELSFSGNRRHVRII